MRILVTGANGFIGKRLVKKLVENDNSVIALTHSPASFPNVEVVQGDLTYAGGLKGLKRKHFDAVFHLAAVLDESSPDLWEVNVNGTRNLLDFCTNRKIDRFVFLSSVGVLGGSEEPLNEEMPYSPETKYERSKAEAERLVMRYRLRENMDYTIFRSTIALGPNEFWNEIFQAALNQYPIIGDGKNDFHLVYVDDLVEALASAFVPKARNEIYHIAGPECKTYLETYKEICDALGTELPDRQIPVSLAKSRAFLHEFVSTLKGEAPRLTLMRSSVERLIRNRRVDTTRAEKDFGFSPEFNVAQGVEKTAEELGYG